MHVEVYRSEVNQGLDYASKGKNEANMANT